jgi:hypothetical protein
MKASPLIPGKLYIVVDHNDLGNSQKIAAKMPLKQ